MEKASVLSLIFPSRSMRAARLHLAIASQAIRLPSFVSTLLLNKSALSSSCAKKLSFASVIVATTFWSRDRSTHF